MKRTLLGLVLLALSSNCSAYTAEVTYYTAEEGDLTYSETVPVEGTTVACDDLPIGTEILIDGQHFVVEDRIGEGVEGRIDIYVDDEEYAWEMGRHEAEVEVLE